MSETKSNTALLCCDLRSFSKVWLCPFCSTFENWSTSRGSSWELAVVQKSLNNLFYSVLAQVSVNLFVGSKHAVCLTIVYFRGLLSCISWTMLLKQSSPSYTLLEFLTGRLTKCFMQKKPKTTTFMSCNLTIVLYFPEYLWACFCS